MRKSVEGCTVGSRSFTVVLLLTLLAASAAVLAACGGDEPTDIGAPANDESAARIAAQVETLDAAGVSLERLAGQADAVEESIVELAEASQADVAAWEEEWAERQSAYAAAVAEVELYNATVARPELKAAIINFYPEPGEPFLTEVVKQEEIPPKPLPARPEPPAKLEVELRGILERLATLKRAVRSLETDLDAAALGLEPADASLALVAVTDLQRLLVVANARSALAAAATKLRRLLAETREALREGVKDDPEMGQVCKKALTRLDLSVSATIERARAAILSAATENDIAADSIPWTSATFAPL